MREKMCSGGRAWQRLRIFVHFNRSHAFSVKGLLHRAKTNGDIVRKMPKIQGLLNNAI